MVNSMLFSSETIACLRYYVYRLIDPRNNETFYVGKGIGNRVFDHVKCELNSGEDRLTAKLDRIREIRAAGFETCHIIHRHDLDEVTAFEVEAALIDAYPDGNNLINGHASDDRGAMSVEQIIVRYEAKETAFLHRVIIVSIGRLIKEMSVYDAARYAWRINVARARAAELILAADRGLIVGVFVAQAWLPATLANFPDQIIEFPKRWGFIGHDAPKEIAEIYIRTRVPAYMRERGAANSVRYYPITSNPFTAKATTRGIAFAPCS